MALLISLSFISHSLAQVTTPPLVGANGANENAIELGDIAVSGFSGTKLQSERLAPTVDPITKTVLDPDGATLEVLNSTVLGALTGQKLLAPSRLSFKARDIGHVFALAFDNGPDSAAPAPALFAAATSAFGIHIVGPDKDGDGQPDRLEKGAAGATFMEGQFGALPGGGPGTIWKIDRKTGTPSLFAELQTGGVKNSGPGIGGIAFDAASRTLYASDLDTGLIHRLSIADGSDKGAFDYGVAARPSRGNKPAVKDDGKRLDITSPAFVAADPATWGFTQKERRIDALAVHDGRLYFAVAEGPEIWSVGLEADGAFKTDARFEVAVEANPPFPVTGLTFDASGRMIVAQRGDVQNPADFSSFTASGPARVLRYTAESAGTPTTPTLWQPAPEEYPIGAADESRASSGGVALEYSVSADGTLDTATCSGALVASGNTLGADAATQGLQLSAAGLVRPANVPPTDSAIIAWKPNLVDARARGYAGGVAVLHTCAGDAGVGFPALAGEDAAFPPVAGDGGGGAGDGGSFPPVAGDGGAGGLPPLADGGGGTTTEPAPPDVTGEGGKTTGLVVVKTASVTTCSPKGGCAFNIEVQNPSPAAVAGPVVIDEQIDAPSATLTGEPNAPWTCSSKAPFSCTHPGPVPANGKLDLRVVFAPNTPPEVTQLKNCALVQGAAAIDPAAPAASQCATIALDPNAPAQTGPIVISKKGAGTCSAKGPCAFTISVRNTTNADVPGPFVVNEQIDAPQATLVGAPNAPWSCTNAAPFSCTHPGPLPANTTTSLELSFAPNTPPEKTQLKNCAIPATGVGGKQGAPAQQKQIAPGKKSELQPGRAFFSFAKLTPQSVPARNGLLHLVGAGGNIGGVGAPRQSPCRKFLRDGFSVQQNNGASVSFAPINQINSKLFGTATFISPNGPVQGRVSGTVGASDFRIVVDWSNGTQGTYTGTIAPGGKATGTSVANNGARVNFTSVAPLQCVEDEACFNYAKDATVRAKVFASEKCGPAKDRWSMDNKHHLDWCMAQPSNAPVINDENNARLNELRECQTRNATNKTRCEAFTNEGVTLGQQFQSLKCPNQPPGVLSTDPAVQMASCLASPTDQFFASAAQARQEHLDLCKKLLAANGGGGAGGGAGGAGGGGVGDAGGQQPAPEQCATVPIEPDVPATAANGLQISKVVTPGTTCTKTNCSFTITVTNTSGVSVPGPIPVIDNPSVVLRDGQPAAPLTSKLVSAPPPPWKCEKLNTIQFKCEHLDPIAAGETKTLNLVIDFDTEADVAAVKNCGFLDENTAVCVNVPVAPQPPPAKQLVLTKNPVTENCSDVGGGCQFVVSITNTGDTDFTDPIAFTDLVSTGDGTPLPNADFGSVQVAGFPDPSISAPFTCKAGGGGLTCSTGALKVKIPPKRTITFPMRIKPSPAAGATAIKNCAQMQLDQFAEPVCRTMPLVNGAQIRASKVTAAQSCFPECAFSVAIQNYGNIDAPGPFVVDDIFKPEDTIASISGIDGEFNCSRVGQKLVCTSTKTVLKPGEFARGRVTVKTNRFVPESENCFEVRPSANFTVDTAAPDKCKTVKQTIPDQVGPSPGPLPGGPIVVEERALKPTCPVDGPCFFEAIFTNRGNVPYEGTLAFSGHMTQGINKTFQLTKTVDSHKLGKCVGAPPADFNLNCDVQNVRLPPQGQVSVLVEVTPGKSWSKGNQLQHCTQVDFVRSVPPPPLGNFAEDFSCATVELDPFSVKVAKTGDQVCLPGSNCTFQLTLFNPGPIFHNAPVTITDKLTGLSSAQIVSITPPLPCATQPTQIPFSCTSPEPVRLDLDAAPGTEFGPRDFVMVVKLPNDASAEQFSNCATVGGDTGASDEACHTVSTKPTEAGACSGGMVMTARGCACPMPTKFNGTVCVGAGGINTTPSTQTEPPPLTPPPVATTPPPQCRGGMLLVENTCACPPLTQWNGRECAKFTGGGGINTSSQPAEVPSPRPQKASTPDCPADRPVGSFPNCCPQNARFANGQCQCLPGFESRRNVCRPVQTAPPPPPKATTCPSDRPVGTFPNCCPQNARFANGQCQCNAGFELRRSVCRPVQTAPPKPSKETSCPADRPAGTFPNCCPQNARFTNGQCECLPGFELKRRVCRPVQTAPPKPSKETSCPSDRPAGTFPNCCPQNARFTNGQCQCNPGFELKRRVCRPVEQKRPDEKLCPDGSKVFGKFTQCPNDKPQLPPKPQVCPPNRPNGTFPNCCPRQMQFRNGQCVDDKCRQGMVGTPPNCACPPGTKFQNDFCRVPSVPQPKPSPAPAPAPKCGPNEVRDGGKCVCKARFERASNGQCVEKVS